MFWDNRFPGGIRGRLTAALAFSVILYGHIATCVRAAPWRVDSLPIKRPWFSISGEQRTRFEGLKNQFRPGLDENDQALQFRTLLRGQIDLDAISVVGELQDARAYLDDEDSAVSTIVVNAVELLQAYAEIPLGKVTGTDINLDMRFGRQTIDLGGRRLVARNRYRNTIQNYTGFLFHWTGFESSDLTAFYVLPVLVQPRDRDGLLDNDIEFDDEDFDLQFWAIFYKQNLGVLDTFGEVYVFGLFEDDDPSEPGTANRNLYTPGFRLKRDPRPGSWDFEVENTLQFGNRRATRDPEDNENLDVFAHFHYLSLGYTAAIPWTPRFSFEYDYASGEGNREDGDWGRFDTLFGPRRTEYGPTGIYGPLGRENLNSPGARLGVAPTKRSDGYIQYRAAFLAEESDVFARTGVVDPEGDSGSFAGHQIDLRARYWLIPGNVRLDVGGAVFFWEDFMVNAPNATGFGDTLFMYSDVEFYF